MADSMRFRPMDRADTQAGERSPVLSGWKEIAAYLGRGVRTVQRWEKLGLPVRRPNAHLRSAVLTNTDEIDAWVRGCTDGRFDHHASPPIYQSLCETVEQLRRDNAELRREVDALKRHARGSQSTLHIPDQGASSQVA